LSSSSHRHHHHEINDCGVFLSDETIFGLVVFPFYTQHSILSIVNIAFLTTYYPCNLHSNVSFAFHLSAYIALLASEAWSTMLMERNLSSMKRTFKQ